MSFLPDFKLETYFSRWEFNTKYNLCASDTESLSLEYLLDLSDDKDKKSLEEIKFGYLETYGSIELREAISSTYNNSSYKDSFLLFLICSTIVSAAIIPLFIAV